MLKRDALKICRQKNYRQIDFSKVGRYIGKGAEGHVYMYGKKRVIKFGNFELLYSHNWKRLVKVIEASKKYDIFPKVYKFDKVNYDLYWIVMEYLPFKISLNEISFVYRMEEAMYPEDTSKRLRLFKGRKVSCKLLDDDIFYFPARWRRFASSLAQFPFYHQDLHCYNVRKSRSGKLKIIDLESFAWRD